jgi:hypothetical protein
MKPIVILTLITALVTGTALAAPQTVTWVGVDRAITNDDGSPYTDSFGVVFSCGTVRGGPYNITATVQNTNLVPGPKTSTGSGTSLSNILDAQPDGVYYCVAQELATSGNISVASNESERIEKKGTIFDVNRVAPNAPGLRVE